MPSAFSKPRCRHVSSHSLSPSDPRSFTLSRQEDTSDWLLTDKVSSWPGTPAERGWRYLRQALERHDGLATEFRYNKAVLEAILSYDRAAAPPPWLITVLEVTKVSYQRSLLVLTRMWARQEHHPEYLMRAHLRYENIEYAFEAALSHIRKVRLHEASLSGHVTDWLLRRWTHSCHGILSRLPCRRGYPTRSLTTSWPSRKRRKAYLRKRGAYDKSWTRSCQITSNACKSWASLPPNCILIPVTTLSASLLLNAYVACCRASVCACSCMMPRLRPYWFIRRAIPTSIHSVWARDFLGIHSFVCVCQYAG